MTDVQAVYSILLARGYQEQLFSSLPGSRRRERGGRETLVDCPFCGKGEHFSYSSQEPVWRCWSCGEAGDWLHYLQKRKGLGFREALAELATEAGLEIVGYDQARHEAYTRRASVLEAAQAHFVRALHTEAGSRVLQYLLQRGYSLEDIEAMELGAYVDRDGLQQELMKSGFSMEDIRAAGLLTKGFGQEYTLALLWRDQAGRPIGLAVRSLLSDQELKERGLTKYRYSYGLERDRGLVGFSRVRGQYRVVLVEGLLDALYLSSKGEPVVAIGGTSLSQVQLRALESTGTRELLLCLDRDEPGQRATEKIVRELSSSNLRIYVVSLPQGYKDPDELVRARGLEAFRQAQDSAERASSWMARRVVSRYDLSTDRGLDSALAEALGIYAGLDDRIEQKAFMKSLQDATGLSEADLASRLQEAAQQASIRRTQAILQASIHNIQQKASQGDITGAELELANALREIRASRGVEIPEPYLLEDLTADLAATPPALSTGYQKLDETGKIPVGALTIIAGRPGHGKTAFQLNLLVRLLRAYPDKSFCFFSYEEARKAIATKLIMIMAGVELNQVANFGAYVNYFQEKRNTNKRIEAAIQEYAQLSASGRLLISDQMYPAEDLVSVISQVSQIREIGAVIVDYIQRIPLLRSGLSQRYLELKLISSLLLEQAVSQDIPVILGAQLGRDRTAGSRVRLDNLRESGDIEQDAHLVLGLYIEAMEKMEQEDYRTRLDPVVDIQISVLKNRSGVAGKRYTLSFDRPILTITDEADGVKLSSKIY